MGKFVDGEAAVVVATGLLLWKTTALLGTHP